MFFDKKLIYCPKCNKKTRVKRIEIKNKKVTGYCECGEKLTEDGGEHVNK